MSASKEVSLFGFLTEVGPSLGWQPESRGLWSMGSERRWLMLLVWRVSSGKGLSPWGEDWVW